MLKLRGDSGFMLLETMLSVLIIASGVALVIRSYAASLRLSKTAAAMASSCMILEEKLFDMDFKGFYRGLTEEQISDAPVGQPGYTWSLTAYGLEPEENDLLAVEASVAYKIGSQTRKVNVSTLRKYREG